jgi:hypothetical protein
VSRFHLVLFAAFELACTSLVRSPEIAANSDETIAVAGVRILNTRDVVSRKLGRELGVVKEEATFCDSELTVFYVGFEAYFCNSSLVNLATRSKRFRTPTGLHVGMTATEAIRRQGTPEVLDSEGDKRLVYRSRNQFSALVLHVQQGRLSEIELWCDFT